MAISFSSTLSSFLSFLSPTKPSSQQLTLPTSPSPSPSPSQIPSQTLKIKPSHNTVSLSQKQQHTPSSSCDELSSVICPSLAYANTLFFKSPNNAEVLDMSEHETEEKLLIRFRKEVMKNDLIQEKVSRQDAPPTKRMKITEMRSTSKHLSVLSSSIYHLKSGVL